MIGDLCVRDSSHAQITPNIEWLQAIVNKSRSEHTCIVIRAREKYNYPEYIAKWTQKYIGK